MVPGEVQVGQGGVEGVRVEELPGRGAGAEGAAWGGEAFAGEGVQGGGQGGGGEVQGGAGGGQVGGVLRGQGEEQAAVVWAEEGQVGVQGAVGWGAVQVRGGTFRPER
ncbi:hypothetical protein IHN32_11445 [Deinococcus sp. 14RED07]|uniref:hypothetical protein n=1 Tax=Deinococcus sp. 14RED07 TaxID=2745874 RepID=UPI001E576DEA|nr:hypothetical protein [Deinococcus sp. 14RED07]MCD0176554.1 hypothetical protein [Deinococcus sp. 14RED07]